MKPLIWTGRVLSALVCFPFVMGAAMKLTQHPDIFKNLEHFGIPGTLVRTIGTLEIISVVLYLVPQTAVLGAIVLTGYLGGAIMTHLRLGEPVVMQPLLGAVAWLALWLRDKRLRELLPLRQLKF